MDLRNTIILSANNSGSSNELTALLKKNDILTIVIFGNDSLAENIVEMADIRAEAIISGITRKVVWMQAPGLLPLLKTLIADGPDFDIDSINTNSNIGIAISMDNKLMDIIARDPEPDFIRMELAYINAGT